MNLKVLSNKKLITFSYLDYILIFLFIDITSIFPLFNRLNSMNLGIGLFNAVQIYLLLFISLFLIIKKNHQNIIKKINDLKSFAPYPIYIFFSLSFYFIFSNLSIVNFFGEIFYSILPIFMLIIGIGLNKNQRKLILKTIILSIFCISILTLLATFNVIESDIYNKIFGNDTLNFAGLYGPIIYGYTSEVCVSLLILYPEKLFPKVYKYFLILFFLFILILTLQRAPLIGLFFTFIIISLDKFKNIKLNFKQINKYTLLGISTILNLLLIIIFLPYENLSYLLNANNIDILRIQVILDEISNFSYSDVLEGRVSQSIIFSESIFNDFFGMGFGRFSKLNDLNITFGQPDASYYRLFNEIGAIGLLTFFYSHLWNLIKNNITLNYLFRFQLITFTLFVFFFNRILWTSPSGFLFYFLIGISLSLERDKILNKS